MYFIESAFFALVCHFSHLSILCSVFFFKLQPQIVKHFSSYTSKHAQWVALTSDNFPSVRQSRSERRREKERRRERHIHASRPFWIVFLWNRKRCEKKSVWMKWRMESGDRKVWITLLLQLYSVCVDIILVYMNRIQHFLVTNITNLFCSPCTKHVEQMRKKYQVHRIHNLKKVSNLMFFAWSTYTNECNEFMVAMVVMKVSSMRNEILLTEWNVHFITVTHVLTYRNNGNIPILSVNGWWNMHEHIDTVTGKRRRWRRWRRKIEKKGRKNGMT